MKIIWINCKRFDKDLSKTSRIEMIRELLNKGHFASLIVPDSQEGCDFGLGRHIKYLPAFQHRIFHYLSFSISLLVYVILAGAFSSRLFVITDYLTCLPLLPLLVLSKLGLLRTKFVLDIRSIPVGVYSLKTSIIGFTKQQIYRIVLALAKFFSDGVTVISHLMKKQICDKYNINKNKVGIWSSSVSLRHFNPNAGNLHMNEGPFGNDKRFIVMYHGALSRGKGLKETVKAIKILNSNYPDIVFFMLGDGEAKGELTFLIKMMNLENNVFLHVPVPYEDVPKYIASCNVGILPFPDMSWWRVSSPLKLIEYLAMEKPVIVTDIEAHRNVLNASLCGIFIKSSEPHEIAQGIIRAYNQRVRLKKIGKEGREIVTQRYTWEKQAEKLLDFLGSL